MTFECPVCQPPFKRREQRKVNEHILFRKEDPAHKPYADKLLRCKVCGAKLNTSQARSKHEATCGMASICSKKRKNVQTAGSAILSFGHTTSFPSDAILPIETLHQSSEPRVLFDNFAIVQRNQLQKNILLHVMGQCRLSQSPSLPQVLLVSENLFYNIKVYFENCCRNMRFDENGMLLTHGTNELCNDFDSYCFTATMLIGKGLYNEFRRVLSKASALIEQILRVEHPRTLACFLEVFIHLSQARLPEVASLLRDFVKDMSAKVTKQEHPWGQICRLLGELDSQSLDQAMAQVWKCTVDTFDSKLGISSQLAVSVRLDYWKRVYGSTNHVEEERLLRDLLSLFGGIPRPPTPRVMLNLAHNLNRQGRYKEAEETALNVLSMLQECEIFTGRIVETIESLKVVSHSQFNQGKSLAAGQTIGEAIQMIVDQWGIKHSWVLEFKNVLEGWLRYSGQEEAANAQRRELEVLIGKDKTDEEKLALASHLAQDR